jgi:DNA-directed RNA polymerase subunit M/transcription elongation factor TFIIS
MLFGMIECNIKCPSCDNPVPLNGPWEIAHCNHCQSDINIPHEYWIDLFNSIYEDIPSYEEGEGTNSTIWGTFHSTLLYARLKPYCLECKTDMEMDWEIKGEQKYKCKSCGNTINVVSAPEWVVEEKPEVKVFVNTGLIAKSDEEKSDIEGPVIFTCPGCGGALSIDGSERIIVCEYCGANVYLPDDLWLRLHPAKKKRRWFIGYSS